MIVWIVVYLGVGALLLLCIAELEAMAGNPNARFREAVEREAPEQPDTGAAESRRKRDY